MVTAASWAPADHPESRSFAGSPPSAAISLRANQVRANSSADLVHGRRGRERVADQRDIVFQLQRASRAKASFLRPHLPIATVHENERRRARRVAFEKIDPVARPRPVGKVEDRVGRWRTAALRGSHEAVMVPLLATAAALL